MQFTIEGVIFEVEHEAEKDCFVYGQDEQFEVTSVKLNGVELIDVFDAIGGLVKFEQLVYEQFQKGQV